MKRPRIARLWLEKETRKYIAAAGPLPMKYIRSSNSFIKGLKADGMWKKMSAIYNFDGPAPFVNLVQ